MSLGHFQSIFLTPPHPHDPTQAEALAIAYVIVGVLLPSLLLPTIGFRLLAKVGRGETRMVVRSTSG